MSRLMSVAFTEQAVVERRKTVTRRKGWWTNKAGKQLLLPGDRLTLCRKVMGRKAGEPLVRLAEVEVLDVRRELLGDMPESDVALEGFPEMGRATFINRFFVNAQSIFPDELVTRIEWRYLDTRADACLNDSGCDGRAHSLPCNNAWFAIPRPDAAAPATPRRAELVRGEA